MNAFDKHASTKKTPAKKASAKIAATGISDEIRQAVDLVVDNKAKIKALKAELDIAEAAIIGHVFPQMDEEARKNNYCKSFTVEGTTAEKTVTVTHGDKWSVPKDPAVHEELKKLLAKKFNEFMKMKRTVNLTDKAMNDDNLIGKFVEVAEELGYTVPEAFTIIDELVCEKGMDEKQFTLPKAKLAAFRTLVKQYKATVK